RAGNVSLYANGTFLTSGNISHGILLQSIGGGGGQGGSVTSNASASADSANSSFSFGASASLSGSGGSAGAAGDVFGSIAGDIQTQGDGSIGFFAQSVGGGGGAGGSVTNAAGSGGNASLQASASFAMGGAGGSGGSAGDVSFAVPSQLTVITGNLTAGTGTGAHGILLQSIGGGGGQGGSILSGNATTSASNSSFSFGASASLSGSGGAGGSAGSVSLGSSSQIAPLAVQTFGDNAHGVFLQSVGGGGGAGGSVNSAAAGGNLSASFAMGGAGGSGARAGNVSLYANGTFLTSGNISHGILLQSIGGGGGQGGSVTSNATAGASEANATFSMGLNASSAGEGGKGGYGGAVTAQLAGTVQTTGDQSIGVFLQSVGGGGGAAGTVTNTGAGANATYSAGASYSMGGAGGSGANGGKVKLKQKGSGNLTVFTEGDNSQAILLQSVGGGGGQGSSVSNSSNGGNGSYSLGGSVGAPGAGGGGGNGGSVTATLKQLIIQTTGNSSPGLMAQSVGGGGGAAGTTMNDVQDASVSLQLNLGASGGDGGSAGKVNVTVNGGQLATFGDSSAAIYAQSVGGGGGQASSAMGNGDGSSVSLSGTMGGTGGGGGGGGSVSVSNRARISTSGVNSVGIYAQSVGGGGGESSVTSPSTSSSNNLNGSLQIGGSGGSGGNGGNVTVTNRGRIDTLGSQAHGVFAQSVGGGGGRVSMALANNSSNTGNAALSVGASGGSGGNAGSVKVTNRSVIVTQGDAAYGIYAQSVGGGGGSVSSSSSVALTFGASGGDGGNAGSITITNSGSVGTYGNNAVGVFAQSVGGGGGDAGTTQSTLTMGASGGTGGSAGSINIDNSGLIVTYGASSIGVFAQSVGGGGGRATTGNGAANFGASGGAGGNAGNVSLVNSGTIATYGEDSIPVLLSSVGGGGGIANSGFLDAVLGSQSSGSNGQSGVTSLVNTGTLQSSAIYSPGILYQSIGGGGGSINRISGSATAGSTSATGAQGAQPITLSNSGNIITLGAYSGALIAQSIGGGGGRIAQVGTSAVLGATNASSSANLNGGAITINSSSTFLLTEGTYSPGILAQTIGGGGGYMGPVGSGNASLGISGSQGQANGGAITVNNSAIIVTKGDYSGAITLQSIGGGGGQVGTVNGSVQLGSINSGGSQAGGNITLNNSASLETTANSSPLLIAQSVGGGGGVVGLVSGSANLGSINIAPGTNAQGGQISIVNTGESLVTRGQNSPAFYAQSVGGGGGRAAAVTGNVTMGASGSGYLSGGNVSVNNTANVATTGINGLAILVQSIGGGGGTAGISEGNAVVLGGSALGETMGGAVSLINSGTIYTEGNNASALLVQSIGGGGGAAAKSAGDLSRLGGTAGQQSGGGSVTINNSGAIQTMGYGSAGFVAQSIGGGGGYIAETNDTDSYDVTLSGTGQEQASGGNLTITNTAPFISTNGSYSPALVAQSIGGGGGWSLLRSNPDAQIGSESGGGMTGGSVNLRSTSNIYTTGASSAGVVIQSIGGGGGVTGSAVGNVTLGASNVSGNLSGGPLTVQLSGIVYTTGYASPAVVVQSIGGGGGLGDVVGGNAQLGQSGTQSSNSNSGTITLKTQGRAVQTDGTGAPAVIAQSIGGGGGWLSDVSVNANLGGTTASGGSSSAGAIQVTNNYKLIATQGRNSTGLLVQSIGGGGGFTGITAGANLILGGSNTGNTTGGNVQVRSRSTITTTGLNAAAMVVQSVGGGGGSSATISGDLIRLGGSGSGDASAGAINVTNSGNLQTEGTGSAALLVQSIGGGGGYISEVNGDEQYSVFFGARGNLSSNGGSINLRNSARQITTLGDYSAAVNVQSIGGGGGYALIKGANRAATRLGSIGADASANGGNLEITNAANIYTQGVSSVGINAQSIGGGGGTIAAASGRLNLGADLLAGSANAGAISFNNSGSVYTQGDFSPALFIQSIGGGGGNVGGGDKDGFSDLGATGVSGRGSSSGGTISVTLSGALARTDGNTAPVLTVQSIGGGGGRVGDAAGGILLGGRDLQAAGGGTISVNSSTELVSLGADSPTAVIQSIGGGGGVVGRVTGTRIGMGGTGLNDAAGGNVSVSNSGDMTSLGQNAALLVVQSIGGGGGFTATTQGSENAAETVNLGSTQSSNVAGGSITVVNSAALRSVGTASDTLLVQSVGGGGGVVGRIGDSPRVFNLTLGGSDVNNAAAGAININNSGALLYTEGDYSRALLVQSIGGGGGWAYVNSDTDSLSYVGANRATGDNAAGWISVVNSAEVVTKGLSSGGIIIQSIGGGGGVIANAAGELTMGSTNSTGDTSGGSVTLRNSGNISTLSIDSPALFVQSIGGGGGRANNIRGELQLGLTGTEGSLTASAGDINITNTGAFISTSGDYAGGLVAQSIGGGGGLTGSILETNTEGRLGSGAYSPSTTVPSLGNSYILNSGNITISNTAEITTIGSYSPALLAQTIAGGGGLTGEITGGTLTMGMNGAAVANAGNITITNSGQLLTRGIFSAGLLAQSIGGGGGATNSEGNDKFFMGSLFGQQSRAGSVTVNNSGSIQTQGEGSVALLAQSIGGGGGYTASLEFTPGNTAEKMYLSGFYTNDAAAGDITVTNSGETVSTLGANSPALLIQSVGGGGGWSFVEGMHSAKGRVGMKGGSNAPGGDITVTNSADLVTLGANSHALRIQSIGGGGGSIAADADWLSLGAIDGVSTDGVSDIALRGDLSGGDVNVTNKGRISTAGENASGLAVLSLGGGGGSVFGSIYQRASMGSSVTLAGDTNLQGGNVMVNSKGKSIQTLGSAAPAVMVQSIGGGGGYVGSIQGDLTMGGNVAGLAMGGSISVKNRAEISTTGNSSPGLLIHSVGGGGGATGPISGDASFALLGSVGSANNSAAAVTVTNRGTVTTQGSNAPALLAQSIGGGGGYTTTSSGTDLILMGSYGTGTQQGGAVSVNNKAILQTQGRGSQALVAQSIGGGGGFVGQVSDNSSPTLILGAKGALVDGNQRRTFIDNIRADQATFDSLDPSTIDGLNDALSLLAQQFSNQAGAGDASAVTVESSARYLATQGNAATVLLAQSIGGGGGWSVLQGSDDLMLLGSIKGGQGNAGSVSVTNSSILSSLGDFSSALLVQSLGGGGGFAGDGGRQAHLGAYESNGSMQGSTVTVNNSAALVTQGNSSIGLLAQSIGGGGGKVVTINGAAQLGSIGVLGAGSSQNSGTVVVVNTAPGIQTAGNNAPALLAQSIGGGGGIVATVNGEVTLGSTDSAGSQQGGNVTVRNSGVLITSGTNAAGLVAQSIGGGGGMAGINSSNLSMQLGSSGGTNLQAGAVTVTNNAQIQTTGNNAAGMTLQSIGGGGGMAASSATTASGDDRLGSTNSSNSGAGALELTSSGQITTAGSGSPALLLQSIGGGGGAIQAIDNAATTNLSLGASGGGNASGNTVQLDHRDGVIATSGENAAGVVVQSIGGGGGWSLAQSTLSTTLGSNGLLDGSAAAVSALLNSNVATSGNNSPALVLQSIGGGGGYGGNSQGNIQLGAINSSGNLSGGAIELNLNGSLQTTGNNAPVVLIQSIGGGGGRAANADGNASLGLSNNSSTGSVDASAADITVTVASSPVGLVSLGDESPALVVQSIGGGGGIVASVNGNANLQGSGNGNLSGGDVTVSTEAMVRTLGNNAAALLAQSIGGGGGAASVVGGDTIQLGTSSSGTSISGTVTVTTKELITTQGRNAAAIVAQSIAGGGGIAYTDQGSVTLGGSVNGLANAGDVTVTTANASTVATAGESAVAVLAQSIAGGGGFVGGSGTGNSSSVRLGGSGNQLGNSGAVSVSLANDGTVQTSGNQSPAVIAQSIGGGGGFTNQSGTSMSLGMSGGRGSNANTVTVVNRGRIFTSGDNSEGVIAQSIGGGGGSAGASGTSLVMGASGGANGSGSDVSVRNQGTKIVTSGNYSIGVVAQSVGAGGGRVASASGSITLGADGGSGDGGSVLLNNKNGLIATSGDYAPAYLIQSVGGGGGVVGIGTGSSSGEVVLGGGSSGTAGSGGVVALTNNKGKIQTTGQYSAGVIHQSIGGGGGWIGSVTSGNVRLGGQTVGRSDGADLNLILRYKLVTNGDNAPGVTLQSLGGGGGVVANVGGNLSLGGSLSGAISASGGSLNYTGYNKQIATNGSDSPALVLQSIGGGGGLVGSLGGSLSVGTTTSAGSFSNGAAITAVNRAELSTNGNNSAAVVLQSIGGGGGLIASSPRGVTIGSNGSGVSRSGDLNLTTLQAIQTRGINSPGVILQSIGGGGALATASGGAIALGGSPQGNSNSGSITYSSQSTIGTGGSGGASGTGNASGDVIDPEQSRNSPAVIAQSIAGGGGYVGSTAGATASSISLGSSNAAISEAADVNLSFSDALSTNGTQSIGVLAQSIGGGGGYTSLGGTSVRVGAIDGARHSAGNVTVTLSGKNATVDTYGDQADGILAQSIGGGGGLAGSSSSSLRLGASRSVAVDPAVLSSSDGGSVTINNAARVVTRGNYAIGIFGQSVGAGGGRAGDASGSVTLGADGGRGDGGAVTLNLNGSDKGNGLVATYGDTAPAFLLQSIGGGGGVVFPAGIVASGSLLLGGGSFGASGSGGSLSFTTNSFSEVYTLGENSSGFVYQTIGGGGGFAGSTSSSAQIGGVFAGRSRGSDLTVVSLYDVSTGGSNAPALLAQTIGGGGGRGGNIGTTLEMGGNGSGLEPDGRGGTLSITVNSNLLSSGANTAPLTAQTIGGGGGITGSVGGNTSLGGSGNGDRRGGELSITISGNLSSTGSNGAALLGQTIGGGGGATAAVGGSLSLGSSGGGIASDSRGGAINASIGTDQVLISSGEASPAVVLQTIGGGGGFSSSALGAVTLGSAAGSNGNQSAARIDFNNAGTIQTSSDNAPAVVLQNIGGGGGYSFGGSSTTFRSTNNGIADAGDITVTNSGTVATQGSNSFGMLVQTIGGGGGLSGASGGSVSLAGNANTATNSGSIRIDNSGRISTTGRGAHALVVQTLAGGGGFVLGGVRRDSSSGSGTTTGRSGNIAVNNSGVISASGENAVALLFQNASGGAYLYQNPDGTVSAVSSAPDSDSSRAGEVVVTNTGVIQSTGVGGIGITKSTNANDTHGNLRVENAEGATIQGGAGGAAIVLVTDQVERVINRGSIIAGDKGRAMALEGVGGNDYVRNYGTIAGNIAIPGALTDFYNAPTGRIEAQFIDLDEQSIVLNSGTISPNGPYRLGTLDIWADYIQTGTGNYEADLVLRSGVTDQLNAASATSIDGTVTLLPNQVGQAKPGSFTSTGIIDTAAGISLDGLELVAPISAVADFSMRLIEGGRDLAFDYSVDYAPKGLSPNSTNVGKAINTIQAAGSTSKFEPTAALVFYDETVSELDDTYRQLSGEALTAFSQVAIDAAQNFQIAVNNNLDEVALNPEARCLAEQQQAPRQPTGFGDQPKQQPAPAVAPCGTWRGWALMSGYDASTPGQGSSDQASYDTTAFGTTIGADALVRHGTLVGAAARWDNLWTTASSLGTSGVTTGWSGMLYAKQALGPETRLTAMLGAGSYSADIRRNLSLSAPATEQSTVNATGYSAQLGVSHRVPIGRASLTPKLGISWLQLKQPGFSESTSSSGAAFQQPGNPLDPVPSPGKASYSLKVASETYTSVPLSFGVEFSQAIKKGSTTWIPRLGIGYSFDLANTQRNMNAQFTAAPGASFDVEGTPAPSQWWTIGLGLDVQLGDRVSLYGGALGQLSPGSTQSINYGGGFRWRF
ncbi:MAG: hypothetical protein RLZZ54_856, partial [Cyanobacteriota bacterium]